MHLTKIAGLFTFIASTTGLNILMSNDDGFASAQLRETARFLKQYGHNVLIVAPVDNESGQGGRSVFTDNVNLTVPSEFNIIPAGSPSLGTDPADSSVWYYNGTPAACVFVALDYVIPRYWNNRTVDLIVSGPNFGNNLGPFLYTLSGTIAAAYAAIGRNIPGIAFSGGNTEQRSYTWINKTTASGYADPATIQGQLAANLTQTLINGTPQGQRLMPLGYGLNVNTPTITSLQNLTTGACINPPFIQTRLTGGAFTDAAVYNNATGLFRYGNYLAAGVNTCVNGECAYPGETTIVNSGCQSSVSVFTIDYDAPIGVGQASIRSALNSSVKTGQPMKMVKKVRELLSDEEIAARARLRHE